jgi:hypothetical protein
VHEPPNKYAAALGPVFPGNGRKGPNFVTVLLPSFPFWNALENRFFNTYFDNEKIEEIGQEKKMLASQRGHIIFSAAEFLAQSGRIVLIRVGNTDFKGV